MVLITVLWKLFLTLIAIDFVSGLVHWAEDTFWTEDTPVVGDWVVKPNVVHHEHPRAFLEKSWWASSWDLLLASSLIGLTFWLFNAFSVYVAIFCIIGANANQLHKYGHVSARDTPKVIRWLQKMKIIQDAKHHSGHHTGDKNTAYCVVTPWFNPILDYIGFWRGLERLTVPFFGAPRRTDLNL